VRLPTSPPREPAMELERRPAINRSRRIDHAVQEDLS
jgi:hypothetical protein